MMKRRQKEGENRDEWPRKGESNPRKPKADVESTRATQQPEKLRKGLVVGQERYN